MANLVFNQLGSGYNATALMEFLQNHWGDDGVAAMFNNVNVLWQGSVPDTLRSYRGSSVNASTLQAYADNYDKFPYFKLADGLLLCTGEISNPFMLFSGQSYGSDSVSVTIWGVSNGVVKNLSGMGISVTPFLSENFWTNFNSAISCPNDYIVA